MNASISLKEQLLKAILGHHGLRDTSLRCLPFGSQNLGTVQRFRRQLVVCLVGFTIPALVLGNSTCGTTHAILNLDAPQTTTAGFPFTVTVNVTINGHPDTEINGRIHFTSSDPTAIVPGDYYFTPTDAGAHTWPAGFILRAPGKQTISGEIIDAVGISGSTNISVSP